MSVNKRPLIIDCDPGIDDAVAIMLAQASGVFDIKAITAVAGNVLPQYTRENARNLAALCGIDCIVAKGAPAPLMTDIDTADYIHGVDGLGGVVLPESDKPFDPRPAWDVIYDEAVKANGELEVAAVGPLTNIAILFRKYPDAPSLIKKLTIMGGGLTGGNHSAWGEFNIWEDALAADIVFRSEVELRMIDLRACRWAKPDKEHWHKGLAKRGPVIDKLREMMAFDCTTLPEFIALRGQLPPKDVANFVPTPPDAVTIAAMIDEDLFEYERHHVFIEVTGQRTYGWTIVDYKNVLKAPLNCEIAVSCKPEKITALYDRMFDYYEAK